MCEPVYHSSTGYALITLEDFFFLIILMSILPSWNPKEEQHIESCQQILNNFDNRLTSFTFEHEMTKEKFKISYDELKSMVHQPSHKLGPIVKVSLVLFVIFLILIVYSLCCELREVWLSGTAVLIALSVFYFDWVLKSARSFNDFKQSMQLMNNILL